MKVIFLDIDGVLNEEKSRSRCCGYKGIDDNKAKNLASIVKATGAEIVLISTWKDDWRKTDKARQGMMANYLDKKLKKQGLYVLDKTASVDKKNCLVKGKCSIKMAAEILRACKQVMFLSVIHKKL